MPEERQRRRLIREAQPDMSKDCGPGTVRHHVSVLGRQAARSVSRIDTRVGYSRQ